MAERIELTKYLGQIKRIIKKHFDAPVWVKAMVTSFEPLGSTDHVGLVLIEVDETRKMQAVTSGRIWAHDKEYVLQRIHEEFATQDPVGIIGWWKVQPDLKTRYSFQLVIRDCSAQKPIAERD